MQRAGYIPILLGLFLMPISIVVLLINFDGTSNIIGPPLSITLLLVANVLLLSRDASNNVLYLVFQITFFIFIVAGPLLDALDGIDFYGSFSSETVVKTYICYWLAVFAMWCYCVRKVNGRHEVVFVIGDRENKPKGNSVYNYERIRFYSKVLFYIAIVAYIAVTLDKIAFRQTYSLQAYYADYDAKSSLPGVVVKIADCYLISFALFLATKPTKQEAKAPIIVFLIVAYILRTVNRGQKPFLLDRIKKAPLTGAFLKPQKLRG